MYFHTNALLAAAFFAQKASLLADRIVCADQLLNVRVAPIVLKKSPTNTSEAFPGNNDSIATHILNHRCVTKARRDWKLRVKLVLRLFQQNRPKAVIRTAAPGRDDPKAVTAAKGCHHHRRAGLSMAC